MCKKQQKSKAIAFTFRPFLAEIFDKRGKKQTKSKAIIALTFRPFLAIFPFFINGQKTAKK